MEEEEYVSKYDFTVPLVLQCLLATKMNNQIIVTPYKSAIQWEHIINIMEYVETWYISTTEPKVTIVIASGAQFIVSGVSFEQVYKDWLAYKKWAKKNEMVKWLN